MKEIHIIHHTPRSHWVGDGFPVRTLFSYHEFGPRMSPFLLLDYAGPTEFPPTNTRRGVDEHPHRGFETVTIVYQGELEHRDSTGNRGKIGPGDVQWMTAASGIVHEEKHSSDFSKRGGLFEVVQLWVNLLARVKMSAPGYQTLLNSDIPVVSLGDGAGNLRVIAGSFHGIRGPARTFTPVNVWDVRVNQGHQVELTVPSGYTTALAILRGKVSVQSSKEAGQAELVIFEREKDRVIVEAKENSVLLLLNGEPINEPIAGYGPFVMNSEDEIAQAITDYQNGKMGHIALASERVRS